VPLHTAKGSGGRMFNEIESSSNSKVVDHIGRGVGKHEEGGRGGQIHWINGNKVRFREKGHCISTKGGGETILTNGNWGR